MSINVSGKLLSRLEIPPKSTPKYKKVMSAAIPNSQLNAMQPQCVHVKVITGVKGCILLQYMCSRCEEHFCNIGPHHFSNCVTMTTVNIE